MMTPAFGPFGSHMSRRTPLHLWAENMATASAVARLRAWYGHEHDERPTRAELRSDVGLGLVELDRVDALVRERTAELARACEERDETLDALAAERQAHDADVVLLGDERDELRRKLRRAQCERDSLLVKALTRPARRFECEHGVRVTIRPHTPGGVPQSDVDV